jgi:hypothetical protein
VRERRRAECLLICCRARCLLPKMNRMNKARRAAAAKLCRGTAWCTYWLGSPTGHFPSSRAAAQSPLPHTRSWTATTNPPKHHVVRGGKNRANPANESSQPNPPSPEKHLGGPAGRYTLPTYRQVDNPQMWCFRGFDHVAQRCTCALGVHLSPHAHKSRIPHPPLFSHYC